MKTVNKRQRRSLRNDQRINPRRGDRNWKPTRTQYRITSIYKATAATLKGEMDTNTIMAGGFHTRLTSMHGSSRHKINKGTQASNNALDQMDLSHM